MVALAGWLLTFLMGILQRIIPFLAAMNAAKSGETPPTPSEVAVESPLKIHAAGHFAGLALMALGIVLDAGLPVLIGAAAGVIGAIAFLVFALGTVRRMIGFGAKSSSSSD